MEPSNGSRLARALASLALLSPAAASQCEVANLFHHDAVTEGRHGFAVDVEGARAVVGAYLDNWNGLGSGAAYVYERAPDGSWSETAQLVPPVTTGGGYQFGVSVALEGDRIVVGASAAEGDVFTPGPGAAYVFDLVGGSWVLGDVLQASDGKDRWRFGFAVDLSGARVVVGAPEADLAAGQIYGPGAAYVFEDSPSGFIELGKIAPPSPGSPLPEDAFGGAVAIRGAEVFVGTRQISPGPFGSGTPQPGQVHVYDSQTLAHTASLAPAVSAPLDGFGSSLAVERGRLLVGAPLSIAGAPFGRVHVFEKMAGSWVEDSFFGTGAGYADDFGRALGLSGDLAVVAAPFAQNVGLPYEGLGAAYFHRRDAGGTWQQESRVVPSNLAQEFTYAQSVALSTGTAVVGAYNAAYAVAAGPPCPPLFASPPVTVATPTTQWLTLNAGAAHAGHAYLVLGSATGTDGGPSLGDHVLPLTVDAWFLFTLGHANGAVMHQSFGVLDANGSARAELRVPFVNGGLFGTTVWHAYWAFDLSGTPAATLASNAMPFAWP